MTTPTPDEYAAGRAAYGWAGDGSDVEHALDLARRRAAREVLSDARPAPESAQGTARAADAAVEAAGGPDTALTRHPSVHPLLVASAYAAGLIDVHEAERAFTPQPRVCPPGRHRPDDDPTPGDRCKDCGNALTWRGPGPNDWDVAEPEADNPADPHEVALARPCEMCGAPAGRACDLRKHAPAPEDPDDDGPFRPRWPLLVSQDTKRTLLAQLAEVVHTPRPSDPSGNYMRGYETGMATVLLALGINEAASPERKSLPRPDDAS